MRTTKTKVRFLLRASCTDIDIYNLLSDSSLIGLSKEVWYKGEPINSKKSYTNSEFSNGNYAARTGDKKYDENYSYDANGNVLTLKRHDDKAVLAD